MIGALFRRRAPDGRAPIGTETFATRGIDQFLKPESLGHHRFGLSRERWDTLAGKAIWVTGGGTGYGQAIAVALAAAGAHVFITGRRPERLAETVDFVRRLGLASDVCRQVPADITSEPELARAVEAIRRHAGKLHGLVNNAGVSEPPAGAFPLADLDLPSWSRLMETNVTGQWLVTRAALTLLEHSQAWRVIFVTSEAGWASTPGVGPYNISKAALNSLGASFAAESAARLPDKDIQINVLVPGEARTEMNRGSDISPFAVVPMTLALLSHPAGGPNGRFFHRDGRHLAFAYSSAFLTDLLDTNRSAER